MLRLLHDDHPHRHASAASRWRSAAKWRAIRLFAPLLLALGLTEFSLHPDTLLELRRAIRDCDLAALRARAPALLRARDRASIEAWLHEARYLAPQPCTQG